PRDDLHDVSHVDVDVTGHVKDAIARPGRERDRHKIMGDDVGGGEADLGSGGERESVFVYKGEYTQREFECSAPSLLRRGYEGGPKDARRQPLPHGVEHDLLGYPF